MKTVDSMDNIVINTCTTHEFERTHAGLPSKFTDKETGRAMGQSDPSLEDKAHLLCSYAEFLNCNRSLLIEY